MATAGRTSVLAASAGRDKAIITADGSDIVGFPDWAEQLIAESTGKNGTGVLPVATAYGSPCPAERVAPVTPVPPSILSALSHAGGPVT